MTTMETLGSLRPETKQFLDICNQYMKCRELMDAKYQEHQKENAAAVSASEKSSDVYYYYYYYYYYYKSEFQQQAIDGTPVKSLAELYEAAEQALPVFRATLERIVQKVEATNSLLQDNKNKEEEGKIAKVTMAPLKGRNRAQEKAEDDYMDRVPGSEVTWLYDVCRASMEFNSAEQLIACVDIIQKDPSINIVKAKNRFQNPTLTGYRDINICIQLDCSCSSEQQQQ
ncbi:unnamed protein product [Cylindrotheca closterium]|uniref:Uncharacterized protein n=1 Tax=Cylindrotheca closterium TaxID=2856 RepID=A0AAD2CRB5_9STRA|nr:unnamed protein product [Cylindrotheca closterium]